MVASLWQSYSGFKSILLRTNRDMVSVLALKIRVLPKIVPYLVICLIVIIDLHNILTVGN